jgi:hypothetical protein
MATGPKRGRFRSRGRSDFRIEPLRGEREDRRADWVDLAGESAIPAHDHAALLVDLVDDAAVAGVQAGGVMRRLDELDPRADGHPGANPSCEESCTLRIHTMHIGFEGAYL